MPELKELQIPGDSTVYTLKDEAARAAIANKLGADQLQEAVNTALDQAKTSGEFDGYTPVRGVDYYTDADKAEFSAYIAGELAKRDQLKPEFANSIAECTDASKLYVLPDGFIYAYMKKEAATAGGWSDNLVPSSTNSDGSIYNGTGYKEGYRMNSSGAETAVATSAVTGFIPCTNADTVRVTGLPYGPSTLCGVMGYISCFDAKFAKVASVSMETLYGNTTAEGITMSNSDGKYTKDSVTTLTFGGVAGTMAYIRVSASLDAGKGVQAGSDLIVTKFVQGGMEVTEDWHSTGHAFVPADYESRIVDAEADIRALQKDSLEYDERLTNLEEHGLSGSASNIIPEGLAWLKGYQIPVLTLTGDTSGMSKDVEKTLSYSCKDKNGTTRTGSCTLKWQGNSSLSYEKKNYTVKFDQSFEVVEGWTAQKKYCLKANFIDHSHSRNLVSCKLWGQIVKSRSGVDSRLVALPNAGAVDGFPIIIVLNGEFHGLYTWNIPKDGWMFGMPTGSNVQQAIVCGDMYTDATYFKALAELDGSDFELEYCSTDDEGWVKTSFNRMLQTVIDSDGSDIDTAIAQYLDIDSAIDYLIDTVLVQAPDCMAKNTLMVTYDGVRWFFGAYDRDSTFGLHWNGKSIYPLSGSPTFTDWKYHRLMNLLWTHKREAIRIRYAELRAGVMSETNVAETFWNFACQIPKPLLLKDVEKWTSIPSSSVSSIDQILAQYRMRCALVDEWIQK